jgi:iron-sulfur cluster repair protein YtfE (RIC family)
MNTPPITPDMTVLDVVSTYRGTEEIFRRYDHQAGECVCCNALFDTLQDVAAKYGLNLQELLAELCAAAQNKK